MEADVNYLLRKIGELTIMLELKDAIIADMKKELEQLKKKTGENEPANHRHKGSAS